MCQINWWLPVYPLARENCLAFYPQYFDRPITNSSEMHNHYKWNAEGRTTAAQHVRDDSRQQPKPQEAVQGPDIRLIPPPGSLILFSGAQLHATVENTSGVARYSVDFRTVHLGDAAQRNGALNVDSRCTGTTLRDYLRGSDLTHIPDDVVRLYDDGTETAQDAVLYFTGVSSPTHFEGR
jgi:ectoine hydroxylase-related dioxygenase (phytanoyl-CoA dioxygenase family)